MTNENSMAAAIIPKSDQLNSDDLIAGPLTIKVTNVTIRGDQEQPVSISYEGDNGKPYKSCKSMNRVLVTAWGADAKQYVGRSMTLYRDPAVKWGGMEVGGIRISHLSHIDSTLTMALTATKGSRKPFTVKPLAVAPASKPATTLPFEESLRTAPTLAALGDIWKAIPAGAEKNRLVAIKDARKAELSKPQTFATVAEAINLAGNLADLEFAAGMIPDVVDDGQRAELHQLATGRAADFAAATK